MPLLHVSTVLCSYLFLYPNVLMFRVFACSFSRTFVRFPVLLPVSWQFSFPGWFSSRLAFVLTCSCSWTMCVPCLRCIVPDCSDTFPWHRLVFPIFIRWKLSVPFCSCFWTLCISCRSEFLNHSVFPTSPVPGDSVSCLIYSSRTFRTLFLYVCPFSPVYNCSVLFLFL